MKRTKSSLQVTKKYFIGIDPGASGAIACISTNEFLWVHDWPGDEVAAAAIVRHFINTKSDDIIYAALENVHSMPREGVSSAFKFGTAYGIWRGILAAFQIPFMQPTPQAWQKGIPDRGTGDKKKAKTAIVTYASQCFPAAAPFLRGPKGGIKDGRADALMIAEWARKQQ